MDNGTDAAVKDMEAAAVAWAAELYDVPYFALKVVTDIGAWHPIAYRQ